MPILPNFPTIIELFAGGQCAKPFDMCPVCDGEITTGGALLDRCPCCGASYSKSVADAIIQGDRKDDLPF